MLVLGYSCITLNQVGVEDISISVWMVYEQALVGLSLSKGTYISRVFQL